VVLALVPPPHPTSKVWAKLCKEVFAIDFGVTPFDQEQSPLVWTARFDCTTDEQVMRSKRVWSLISSAFKVSLSECARCFACADWGPLGDVL
jgi:hypothetical protein